MLVWCVLCLGVVVGTVFVFAWLRVAVCGCVGLPGLDSDMG